MKQYLGGVHLIFLDVRDKFEPEDVVYDALSVEGSLQFVLEDL